MMVGNVHEPLGWERWMCQYMQVKSSFYRFVTSRLARQQFWNDLFGSDLAACFAANVSQRSAQTAVNSIKATALLATKCMVHKRIEELTAHIATSKVVTSWFTIFCLQLALCPILNKLG